MLGHLWLRLGAVKTRSGRPASLFVMCRSAGPVSRYQTHRSGFWKCAHVNKSHDGSYRCAHTPRAQGDKTLKDSKAQVVLSAVVEPVRWQEVVFLKSILRVPEKACFHSAAEEERQQECSRRKGRHGEDLTWLQIPPPRTMRTLIAGGAAVSKNVCRPAVSFSLMRDRIYFMAAEQPETEIKDMQEGNTMKMKAIYL